MKKLILIIASLILVSFNSSNAEENKKSWCIDKNSYLKFGPYDVKSCKEIYQDFINISENLHGKLSKNDNPHSMPKGLDLSNKQLFDKYYSTEVELERKAVQEKAKKERLANLEKKYTDQCKRLKGTSEFENCLLAKEKENLDKQKELNNKLAKMSQMERIEYQCENIFKFTKNSVKFKDCTLKVYVAEAEAQRIDLEKQLVLAKLQIEKTKELEQQATLLAQRDQSNTESLGSFLDLLTLGLQIYSLTSPVPIPSAAPAARAFQCFTSGMFKYCS